MKDRSGRVIGFEKLNFSVPESDSVHVAVETARTGHPFRIAATRSLDLSPSERWT
jgi:hypothetical protein